MEEEKRNFIELLGKLRETDADIRTQAENDLDQLFYLQFPKLSQLVVFILQGQSEKSVNDALFVFLSCCTKKLRAELQEAENFSGQKYEHIREGLSTFYSGIVESAKRHASQYTLKQIGTVVGDIAIISKILKNNFSQEEAKKLQEQPFLFLSALRQNLCHSKDTVMDCSNQELKQICISAYSDGNIESLLLIGEIISSLCEIQPLEDVQEFDRFLLGLTLAPSISEYQQQPGLVRKFPHLVDSNSQFDQLLDIFADISENQPQIMKGIISEVVEQLQEINQVETLSFKQKFAYLESICTALVSCHPDEDFLLTQNQDASVYQEEVKYLIDSLVQLIFMQLKELNNSWLDEPDDDSERQILEPLHVLNLLLQKNKINNSLVLVSKGVQVLMSRAEIDSTFQLTAFLLLSQVGGYIDNITEVSPIVNMIIENCQSPKAELRFASFHCLGELASDLHPKFQEYYGDGVLSHLIVGCKEEHLKLRSCALQSLKSFITGSKFSQIANFLPSLVQIFLENFSLESFKIKVLSLECMNLTIKMCKTIIKDLANDIATPLLKLSESTSKAQTFEGQLISGMSLETCCVLVKETQIKGSECQNLPRKLIQLILESQNKIQDQSDPRWSIFLNCWGLLLDAGIEIPTIPLEAIISMVNQGMADTIYDLTQSKEFEIPGTNKIHQSIDFDKLSKSFSVLKKMAVRYPENVYPYLERYVKSALGSVSNLMYQSVRLEASLVLPEFLTVVKCCNRSKAADNMIIELTKVITKILMDSCQLEMKPAIIAHKIQAICEAFRKNSGPIFTQFEISQIYKSLLQTASRLKIDTVTLKLDDATQSRIIDDADFATVEPNFITEGEVVFVALGKLATELLRYHRSESHQMMLHLVQNFAIKIVQVELPKAYSASMQKFALNLIVDYLEHFGFEGISEHENDIYSFFIQSCYNPHWILKHAAISGLSIFAKALDIQFIQYTKETFETLYDLQKQRSISDENTLALLREVLLITWGDLLQILFKNLENPMEARIIRENTEIWILSLPLEFQRQQGIRQYTFMLQLIDKYFEQLAGDKMQDINHLIELMFFVYQSNYSTIETNSKVEKLFNKLYNVDLIKQKIQLVHERLSPDLKKKLEACLKKGLGSSHVKQLLELISS